MDEGAFDDCIDWRITKFSEFPAAVAAHRAELEGKTVVSYCTGGIRCEKAAIVLNEGLRLPTGGRHPQVLRGDRRRPLPRRLFRL